MAKKHKNSELRVICLFGMYAIYRVLLDDEDEIRTIGDNVLAKEYNSYSSLLIDIDGIISTVRKPVVTINAGNKSLYGIR